MRRTTSVATPTAHLVGPGKLKVVNGHMAFARPGEAGAVRLEPRALRAVYCYGGVSISDEALTVLFAHDVEVAFLTAAGTRCRGRLVRSDRSHTTLRLLQHRMLAEPARVREAAARVVLAKVESQEAAARHHRKHGVEGAKDVLARLAAVRLQVEARPEVDVLRGLEGAASAAWFDLLGQVLRPPWRFVQRVRRPPTDPVNALLSLGYTWLLARTVAACEAAGLEVNLGALHEYRPGRPSLACDLMEALRVPAVDRWVVFLCNQGLVCEADFVEVKGGIRLQPERFGSILHEWEKFWVENAQESELERMLAGFTAWLREGTRDLPGPSDEDEAEAL